MSITPMSPAINQQGWVQTWVTSQWKNPSIPGQFSAEINNQSVQGFRSGDYSLGQIWLTRAKAMRDEGLPIGWSYQGAFLVGDRISLLRGAPNRENALKLISYWLDSPQAQAAACEVLSCTPPSSEAIAMMSEEVRSTMPTAEDINESIVVPDAEWINENAAMLLQRWNEWIR